MRFENRKSRRLTALSRLDFYCGGFLFFGLEFPRFSRLQQLNISAANYCKIFSSGGKMTKKCQAAAAWRRVLLQSFWASLSSWKPGVAPGLNLKITPHPKIINPPPLFPYFYNTNPQNFSLKTFQSASTY